MIRLSATLKARAQSYADDLGISLNALVSVALNDYLNARAVPAEVPLRSIDPTSSVAFAGAVSVVAEERSVPDIAPNDYSSTPRNAPCPCGSGKKFKQCHGKPGTAA